MTLTWCLIVPGQARLSVATAPPEQGDRSKARPIRLGKVVVDTQARVVTIPAWINMRAGLLEYVLVTRSGKTHESLLVTEARPRDVQAACLLLHAQPSPVSGEPDTAAPVPESSALEIEIEWGQPGGTNRAPLSSWLHVADGPQDRPRRKLSPGPWLFNGSFIDAQGYAAEAEGSIISLIRDGAAVINNPRPDRDHDDWHVPNPNTVPEANTPVRVLLKMPPVRKVAPPAQPELKNRTSTSFCLPKPSVSRSFFFFDNEQFA